MRLQPLEALLVQLMGDLCLGAGDAQGGIGVDEARLALPVELRLGSGGALSASLPRWRLATGFEPLVHRLQVRAELSVPAGDEEVP